MTGEVFARWMAALERRHMADLRPPEIARALRALSSIYVERRAALGRGAALDSAGKRAAFALFYGPLHYLVVRHVVEHSAAARAGVRQVIDLGCGTGAAGAAWAVALARQGPGTRQSVPTVLGIDRHPWAVEEARWTYRTLGLPGTARRGDVTRLPVPRGPAGVVLAFTLNELPAETRAALLPRLVQLADRGAHILVVEPIARSIASWWQRWADAFRAAGGAAAEWRAPMELPDRVRALDRAAGLDHRVLTARSLYLGASS